MAASTLANLEGSLKRIYTDELFEVALNTSAPFWMMLQEEKNIEPEGEGYYWPFYLATPQNIGTPGENSNLPVAKPRTEVQGRIRPGQFISDFEISFILEAVGTARGAWNKGEVKRHMWESITDLTKHVNRIYAGTHGTGRLAQVESNTSSTNAFVAAIGAAGQPEPVGAYELRPNMTISIFADDTGSGAAGPAGRTITKIVQNTRTVTFDGAAASLTAGDDVYITSSYGQTTVPNGIMGLVDDGSLLTTIHNQSRNTYEELKSKVDSSATLRNLDEQILLRNCFDVYQLCGQHVSDLLMNSGQVERYINFVRPDRRYVVASGGKGVPDYKTGYDEGQLEFLWGGKKTKVHMIADLPPRTVVGITRSMLRRFTLKKMSWFDQGGGSIFAQGVDSGGYKTTKQATLIHLENIGTFMPRAHFRIQDLNDPQMLGAVAGGTDAS